MKSSQAFHSYPLDIPLQRRKSYRQKQPLNGQLCNTAILKKAKNTRRLLITIKKLRRTSEVIYKSNHFYYCRNSTQFPELCDKTVALPPYTGCYTTRVVH